MFYFEHNIMSMEGLSVKGTANVLTSSPPPPNPPLIHVDPDLDKLLLKPAS